MKKEKILNDLNKILKSRSSHISIADKKRLRLIIKEIEHSPKVDWQIIISSLAKLVGLGKLIYKVFKE
ncbi:MAG: hypothetical protein ABI855_05755 [Bacteroidota bacterium]